MRLIGIDWGEARVGVAVSDPLNITAQPVGALANGPDLMTKMKEIVDKFAPVKLVIGLPKQMNGRLGPAAEKVKTFYDAIRSNIPVEVEMWDERLTTKIAQRSMVGSGMSHRKQRSVIDAAAAAIMLQSYIDAKKHADTA